ncbi:unnamed protein product, partial [Ectocarpus sp. 13 AM-2016]
MGLRSGNGPANSSQSRISAWFAALVVLAGSVFLLEYVVFFNAGSGRGGSDMGSGQQGTPPEAWRLPHPPANRREPDAVATAPQVATKAAELRPVAPASSSTSFGVAPSEEEKNGVMRAEPARRLAVVVPAHAG